jgi:hypothetical protein
MSSATPTLRIPDDVADALLPIQPRRRTLTPEAKRRGLIWRLFNAKAAIVEQPVPLGAELAFWEIQSDDQLEDFLFGRLLVALPPQDLRARVGALPSGYRPLLDVLEFELHRQFEGWTAATNYGAEEVRYTSQSYTRIGLADESRALLRVAEALADSRKVDDELEERLERVYASEQNSTPTFELRLISILEFVRSNPTLFGVLRSV